MTNFALTPLIPRMSKQKQKQTNKKTWKLRVARMLQTPSLVDVVILLVKVWTKKLDDIHVLKPNAHCTVSDRKLLCKAWVIQYEI